LAFGFSLTLIHPQDPKDDNPFNEALVPIAEEEKTQIKQHLTNLMLASPKHVQLQLSEALTIIW